MKRTTSEMIGEFLREAGLLILVFVPVDSLIDSQRARVMGHWLFALFVFGIVAVIIGIAIERRRQI